MAKYWFTLVQKGATILRYILWVFTGIIVLQTLASFVEGDFENGWTGFFLSIIFGAWSLLVYQRRKLKNNLSSVSKPKASRNKKEPKQSPTKVNPSKPNASKLSKFKPINDAALRLRRIATGFEDPRESVVFRMEPLRVTRTTKTQHYAGSGGLIIKRDGILVGYSNVNAREPKLRQMDKKWSEIVGVVPTRSAIYYQDHSSFEFDPLSLEDHLVLNVFWYIFQEQLNGTPYEIIDPRGSVLGQKLRRGADYLDQNAEKILAANGALNLERLDSEDLTPIEMTQKPLTRPQIGSVIDDYKLERELGGGTFGTVFLGREINDPDDLVAFKIMNMPTNSGIKVGSPAFYTVAEHFIAEAKKSLNFAGSAYVLNAIEHGMEPWPWIAYPLVKGGSLQSLLTAGQLSDDGWWNLAHDLLSGLRAIEIEGLVHLDIKPDNIMLSEDRFTILDLGVSSIQGYEFGQLPSGTIVFMSPEVLKAGLTLNSEIKVTGAADVFSAGLTLLWCATQRYYFEDLGLGNLSPKELQAKLYNHLVTNGVPLFDLSEPKQALLTKMLELDPKKRASANDLLFDVAKHVDIDKKISQMESATGKLSEMAREKLEGGEEVKISRKLDGPFSSWSAFGGQIKVIVEDIRPAYFTIEFDFYDSRESMYVQALYASGGWVMECMSDEFAEQQYGTRQKQRLVQLGWSPPSDSSPNFERIEEMIGPEDMTAKFVTALEDAFEIKISEISRMSVNIQNRNAY